jgi:hypothetical protein
MEKSRYKLHRLLLAHHPSSRMAERISETYRQTQADQ